MLYAYINEAKIAMTWTDEVAWTTCTRASEKNVDHVTCVQKKIKRSHQNMLVRFWKVTRVHARETTIVYNGNGYLDF